MSDFIVYGAERESMRSNKMTTPIDNFGYNTLADVTQDSVDIGKDDWITMLEKRIEDKDVLIADMTKL